MPTFSPNKNLTIPNHNEFINSWDTSAANPNYTLIDTCFSGTLSLNATGLSGSQALTQTQVQPPTIQISGAPTAAITYTVPSAIGGVWTVRNTTTGGFAVGIASLAGGSTVTIPAGNQLQVWCDGTATGMLATVSTSNLLTGIVMPFAGSAIPSGMNAVFANGQAISRTTFANLFAIIGTTYGTGDGVTTFNVPDLRGTVTAGMDTIGGSTNANRLSTVIANSSTLGTTGGSQNTSPNIFVTGSVQSAADNSDVNVQPPATGAITVANAGHAHQVTMTSNGANTIAAVQPTMVLNYVIFT